MPWYYLLIIIINGQATAIETHSGQECLAVKQYLVENTLKQVDKKYYALECFPEIGGEKHAS